MNRIINRSIKQQRTVAITNKLTKSFSNLSVLSSPLIINRKFNNKGPTISNNQFRYLSSNNNSNFEFETLAEMFDKATVYHSDRPVFGTRVGVGAESKYEWINYKNFGGLVENFKKVLVKHNIGHNDKISIISNNRLEWAVAKYAAVSLGAVLVPMYEAQLEKDWTYIIDNSDSKLIIAATESVYKKTKSYIGKVGIVKSVICLDGDVKTNYSYKYWMNKVEKEPKIPTANVSKNDIAVIIYTSGTTGFPKGVELSHENCCSNIIAVKKEWGGELEDKTTLAFLPWAHVFGQTMELHSLFSGGSAMAIVSNRELIVESIPLVKPSMIISVPALFNKVYDGVMKKMNEGSPIQKSVFFGSLAIARERNNALEFGLPVGSFLAFKYKMADKVVFSKIREKLGGNLTCMASGGAATSLEVLQFFEDIGIPIVEGYGLTETSPVISSGNRGWANRRLATTGRPLKNLDVRILDPDTKEEQAHDTDGEICVSGPSVMTGYRKNQAANDEVFFMKDGKRFFRTGDLGRMVEGKFLKITGRIKEQYKLENGKFVVPAPLEDMLSRSQFIAQSFIHGVNQPNNVVLIVPEFIELRGWAKTHNIEFTDDASLLENDDIVQLLSVEIEKSCLNMKSYERPTKWAGLIEPFSQDNQMLTPKMSLRRNNVLKEYQDMVDNLYVKDSNFGISINKRQ